MIEREENNHEHMNNISIRNIISYGGRFIDYKIGFLGAGFMGVVVFLINYTSTEELSSSIIAGTKQGIYTFFFGGAIMKSCEYLATNIRKRYIAILAAVLIPSIITLSLTFVVHKLKGTPLPIESTLPTLLVIPSTIIWGTKKRKEKL